MDVSLVSGTGLQCCRFCGKGADSLNHSSIVLNTWLKLGICVRNHPPPPRRSIRKVRDAEFSPMLLEGSYLGITGRLSAWIFASSSQPHGKRKASTFVGEWVGKRESGRPNTVAVGPAYTLKHRPARQKHTWIIKALIRTQVKHGYPAGSLWQASLHLALLSHPTYKAHNKTPIRRWRFTRTAENCFETLSHRTHYEYYPLFHSRLHSHTSTLHRTYTDVLSASSRGPR